MLVLSRRKGERIVIGTADNPITVEVVEIRGDRVRLGVVASKQVPVHREEVWTAIHGPRLRRVCSWCETVMDEGTEGAGTTHGICGGCKDRELAAMPRANE